MESRPSLPMDGLRPDVLPQRNATIRGRGGTRLSCSTPDFFYGVAAYGDAAEFVEDQRPVFFAGEASDD
jgi:hypothetical protein